MSARTVASLQLLEQARLYLQEEKPDEAIRTLERAVNLHPTNGAIYYYLAEAWIMKGHFRQAGEFHEFATIYLRNDARWKSRLMDQQEKISKGSRK